MTKLISAKGFKHNLPKEEYIPHLLPIKQQLADDAISNVPRAAREAVNNLNLGDKLSPGDRVLVTAGSRGIADMPEIIAAVCRQLKVMQFEPTILGAMGSHGGGTKQGQREVLEALGITEETTGATIKTSNEAVVLGEDKNGQQVYCDPLALEYDGLIALNRVKPHTTAHGEIQSGLIKILVVGMGHHKGAESFHQSSPAELSETLVDMYRVIKDQAPFLGGIAMVENAHKRSAIIEGIPLSELVSREKQLLKKAEEFMPTLPFDAADVLVILQMGKDYSGTGMDTNVIGRRRIQGVPAPDKPRIGKIAVLDLSDSSHGNACGVGLADFMTSRLAKKIDLNATYLNVLTSRLTMRAMFPMIMQTDRDAVSAAITTSGITDPRKLRLAVIKDTLHLDRLWVSPALWEDISHKTGLNKAAQKVKMTFEGGDEKLYLY